MTPGELVQTYPDLFIYDDSSTNIENFVMFLKDFNIDYIKSPSQDSYINCEALFDNLFFKDFIGYLIDINLINYKIELNNSLGIRDGVDIAKYINEYNANLLIANYSVDPPKQREKIPFILKDKNLFSKITPFLEVLNSKINQNTAYISIKEFDEQFTISQKINYIKYRFKGRNPELYFKIYETFEFIWYIENSRIITHNGPSFNQNLDYLELKNVNLALNISNIDQLDESFFSQDMDKEVPLIFWNFII
ncbi:hypothetical protein GO730_39155 [Spirosoma sp. HMF3257]|uniref:Uncharacterized protein n=1 Tax=Spirosoma telluris TaxID=2183553 RepID=A0A327NCD7_9BACT|nr:hypothetical protein [Spirosoma telluris]RAI72911.1 hypothetical protein HMF3257_39085 [Spirosoma telluris]